MRISIVESDFRIPACEAALARLIEADLEYDYLKARDIAPPHRLHFQGLPHNWIFLLGHPFEVFLQLGFRLDSDGLVVGYEGDDTQQDLFLLLIAPWVAHGSSITWRNEFGLTWRHVVYDGILHVHGHATAPIPVYAETCV